jgi:hypothetical protein
MVAAVSKTMWYRFSVGRVFYQSFRSPSEISLKSCDQSLQDLIIQFLRSGIEPTPESEV